MVENGLFFHTLHLQDVSLFSTSAPGCDFLLQKQKKKIILNPKRLLFPVWIVLVTLVFHFSSATILLNKEIDNYKMIYISPWFVHIIKQSNMRERSVICKTIIISYSILANCLRILEWQWKKITIMTITLQLNFTTIQK